jgi:hypothetical protein
VFFPVVKVKHSIQDQYSLRVAVHGAGASAKAPTLADTLTPVDTGGHHADEFATLVEMACAAG